MVRALASHQCVPGSIPGPGVMWVEFVVGSLLCSERFFPRVLRFSPLLKNQHFQIPILAWKVSPISARALETFEIKFIIIIIIIIIVIYYFNPF